MYSFATHAYSCRSCLLEIFIVFEPIKPIKDPTGKCDSIRVCCKWIHPILYFYSNDIPLFAIPLVSVCLFVSILLLVSSLFAWIIFYLFCRKILKQGQDGKEQYLTHWDRAQEMISTTWQKDCHIVCQQDPAFWKLYGKQDQRSLTFTLPPKPANFSCRSRESRRVTEYACWLGPINSYRARGFITKSYPGSRGPFSAKQLGWNNPA